MGSLALATDVARIVVIGCIAVLAGIFCYFFMAFMQEVAERMQGKIIPRGRGIFRFR